MGSKLQKAEEASQDPPRIARDEIAGPKPFWSVMVPAYNPPKPFLAQALQSVLEQDPGAAAMEIVVVDDCSPDVDVRLFVEEIGKGRVGFAQTPSNLGLAGCWNYCIERSRGEWVHLLHQDDYVLPGFYKRLRAAGEAHPEVSLIAARSFFVGEDNVILDVTRRLPRMEDGSRSAEALFYESPIQCPGVVVRRSFYEQHGGFRKDLSYALDYEMWARVIELAGGLVTADVLACYRRNSGNETGRLWRTGEAPADIARLNRIFEQRYPKFDQGKARRALLNSAQYWAETFARRGEVAAAKSCEDFWYANAGARLRMRRAMRKMIDCFPRK